MTVEANPPIGTLSFVDLNSTVGKQALITILDQLWRRTGGGDDSISNAETQELYPWQQAGEDQDDNRTLFSTISNGKVFDVISVTADHTTSGNEILICNNTSTITITLNATPDDEEELFIKRRISPVRVTSTKGVDGDTTKVIINRYDSPHIIFTGEADEYSII
jgi:hypothetical protein